MTTVYPDGPRPVNMTRQEFLAWERVSRDTIDVKRCYIDLAGSDLVAGILLSQIIYWHLPTKDGGDKLMIERDGEKWLAKGRADWWDECRISTKQFDRTATLLETLGLIETRVWRFQGSPTKHIRVCWDVFLRDLTLLSMHVTGGKNDIPQKARTELPQRETDIPRRAETILPEAEGQETESGKLDVSQRSTSYTESPAETFKESNKQDSETPSLKPQESSESVSHKIVLSDEGTERAKAAWEQFRGCSQQGTVKEYESLLIHCQDRLECFEVGLLEAIARRDKKTLRSPVAVIRSVAETYLGTDRDSTLAVLDKVRRRYASPAQRQKDDAELVDWEGHLEAEQAALNSDAPAVAEMPAKVVKGMPSEGSGKKCADQQGRWSPTPSTPKADTVHHIPISKMEHLILAHPEKARQGEFDALPGRIELLKSKAQHMYQMDYETLSPHKQAMVKAAAFKTWADKLVG